MAARQRVSMRHRTCQEASLASCCPICELKFPSKVSIVKADNNRCKNILF